MGFGDGDKEEVDFKNPVYANVFFEKTHENGAPVQGIIAINYDNPKEFKLLASDTSAYNNLRISPDKEKLIYTDKYITGLGSAPQYGVYNTITKKKELLYEAIGTRDFSLTGHESIDIVWNKESNGFYFTNPDQPYSSVQSIFYYDLETRKAKIIKQSPPHGIFPLSLISKDTLLVYSTEFDTLAYYRTDLNGDYINLIKNPNLNIVIEDNLDKKGFLDENYNDSLGLITASYLNTEEFKGYKIIVTDLEGTFFKEFTKGIFLNRNPMWTKDGNIIFTEQRDIFDGQIESELKLIDLETGDINPFFSKREYPEITGIGNSDQ